MSIRIDVVTLFPEMVSVPMMQSLIGRAQEKALLHLHVHNLRTWSKDDKHRTIDDRPYGGGPGMVLQAEPLYQAIQAIKKMGKKDSSLRGSKAKPHVIFMSPQGGVFSQKKAETLSTKRWLILICGHYEGIDERVMSSVDEEISIGDYVLTGGELPAMVVIDSVVRLLPGVVKEPGSILEDSFQRGLLDYPHYTRPDVWRRKRVPPVLLSGDHKKIEAWRREQALSNTKKKRPDLLPPRS